MRLPITNRTCGRAALEAEQEMPTDVMRGSWYDEPLLPSEKGRLSSGRVGNHCVTAPQCQWNQADGESFP